MQANLSFVDVRNFIITSLAAVAVLLLAGGTLITFKELATRMPVQQSVDPQVGELAARLRVVAGLKLETVPVVKGSLALLTVAKAFGFEELPAGAVEHMLEVSAPAIAEAHIWGTPETRTDYRSVPGISWNTGRLVNQWGGAVRLFRKEQFTMVAFEGVPDDLCERMRLGRASASSYIFACNNTFHLIEDGYSVTVDPDSLRPMPAHRY